MRDIDVMVNVYEDDASGVLVVRRGPGANCSSIGSPVEMLFLSATIGAAVLAAVNAAFSARIDPPDENQSETTVATPPDESAP